MPPGGAGALRRCGVAFALLVAASGLVSAPVHAPLHAQVMADGMGVNVEDLKQDVVARLADCETGGKANRDTLVVTDTNGQASIGRLQFQTRTVIAYIREIEERRIDAGEARRIALDPGRSATLAKRIIFERDGAQHWHHCARKLGLYQEVKALQRLTP